ncbi:MAG: sel1 repeat family protein [Clostridia bacterium]|nr:sel1 repeat family protein [Clostridia bacterium]
MKTVVSSSDQNTGDLIRRIIQENGKEILMDTLSFSQKFLEKGGDPTVSKQLSLIVEAGNIRNYLAQTETGISLIDVNNIISCSEKATGLNRKIVKDLVSDLLHGLSMPTQLERVVLPTSKGYQLQDISFTAFGDCEKDLEEIGKLLEKKDMEGYAQYAQRLEDLAGAGHPEALYLKGICFYEGIGTQKNSSAALPFFRAAAYSGHLKAQAMLGDYYAQLGYPLNTKAFGYYTALGSTALSDQRKKRVSAILNQEKTNFTTLIGGGVFLFLILVFNILLGAGVFSYDGVSHWIGAIFSILLNVATFFLAVLSFVKYRYDSVKWMIPAMAVITFVFAMLIL